MSHVSEGDLHAYLDGALEEYPSVEAARVRAHLDGCESCMERLEDERVVRDEAAAILDGVLPRMEMPPFEELRARAAALSTSDSTVSEKNSGGSSLARLGWAASVLVALGVGYVLRGGDVPLSANEAAVVQEGAVRSPVLAAAEEDRSDLRSEEAAGVAPAMEASASPVSPSANDDSPNRASANRTPEASGARAEIVQVAAAPAAPPVSEAVTPSPIDAVVTDMSSDGTPSRVGLDDLAQSGRVAFRASFDSISATESADGVASGAAGTPVERMADEVVSLRLPDPDAETEARNSPAEEEREARRRTAVVSALQGSGASLTSSRRQEESTVSDEVLEEGRMGVPGLETLSITWIAEGIVAGGVSVEQALAGGDTLTLLHLPQGVQPDDVPLELADGERELVVPRGEGWLLLRARRSFDDLRGLLKQMDSEGSS